VASRTVAVKNGLRRNSRHRPHQRRARWIGRLLLPVRLLRSGGQTQNKN